MRVLVDFTQVPLSRTGAGVYAEHLVRELIPKFTGTEDNLFLLLQEDEDRIRKFAEHSPNVTIVTVGTRLFRNRALLLLYEQLALPFLLLRKRIDVVHSLHYTHPLVSPCARLVTVHDLTFLLFPELHTLARRLIMPFFIRRAVRHADGLVFDSIASQRDAQKLIPTTKENLRRITPLGVDSEDFNGNEHNTRGVLEKFSIEKPFLLFVGTIEPRKNIARLIRAFELLANEFPNLLLVIAGKPGWHFENVFSAMRNSEYQSRIRYLNFITDTEKKALLSACAALAYPSLYEGFGLPILEGMAAGAPVITGNVSSLPEVAGDAAILIDPLSVEQLAEAIRTVLRDPAERNKLSAMGRKQAAAFSWARTATLTFEAYQDVLKNRNPRR
jgi:glycosyltransferase involved in cell wall biosynthesis